MSNISVNRSGLKLSVSNTWQIMPNISFVLCRGKKIIIGLEQHVGEEITAFEFFEFVWRVNLNSMSVSWIVHEGAIV